jgi:hypothetical protein
VVPDILGRTANLVVEHCKIVGEGSESRALPSYHTVEVDMSPAMAGDTIGLVGQSLGDMEVLWAMAHTSLVNCHKVEADQEQHIL